MISLIISYVKDNFVELLLTLPVILWALPFHEFCHAWAALKSGDPTARDAGRLTLNPLAHFDLWGTISMLLFSFGWAKPVPFDPRNFRDPRRGYFLVGVAGVAGNIVSAVAAGLVIRTMDIWIPEALWDSKGLELVLTFLMVFVIINLNLAVFNLLPIPPLDGAGLLYLFIPRRARRFIARIEPWGGVVLVALILVGFVDRVMSPVVSWAFSLIVGFSL